jgi:hypothetical protein
MRTIAKMQEIAARPKTTPEQRARIQELLKTIQKGPVMGQPAGEELGATFESQPRRAKAVLGGIGKGALGALDITAAIGNVALPGRPLQRFRDIAAEGRAAIEEAQGRQTLPEQALGLGAELISAGPIYGKVSQVVAAPVLAGLARFLPKGSKLVGMLQSALESPSRVKRAVGTAIAGAPLDVLQGTTLEEATPEQKLKQVGIGLAADLVGGAILSGGKRKVKIEAPTAPVVAGEATPSTLDIRGNALMQIYVLRVEYDDKIKLAQKAARMQWRTENPGAKWSELKPTEQRKIMDDAVKPLRDERAARIRQIIENPQTAPVVTPVEAPKVAAEIQEDLFAARQTPPETAAPPPDVASPKVQELLADKDLNASLVKVEEAHAANNVAAGEKAAGEVALKLQQVDDLAAQEFLAHKAKAARPTPEAEVVKPAVKRIKLTNVTSLNEIDRLKDAVFTKLEKTIAGTPEYEKLQKQIELLAKRTRELHEDKPAPRPVAVVPQEQLVTLPLSKPLSQHTLDELRNLGATLGESSHVQGISDKDLATIQSDMFRVRSAIQVLRTSGQVAALKGPQPKAGPEQPFNELRRLYKPASPRGPAKFIGSNTQLDRTISLIDYERAALVRGDPALPILDQMLDDLQKIRGVRRTPGPTEVKLESSPEVAGGIGGAIIGSVIPADDDQERFKHMALGALIGAGAGFGLRRLDVKQQATKYFSPEAARIDKAIVDHEGMKELGTRRTFRQWLFERYVQTTRPSEPAGFAEEAIIGRKGRLPPQLSAYFRMSRAGNYIGLADEWMLGTPTIERPDGTRVQIPGVKNLQQIGAMVNGDIKNFRSYLVAATAIEKWALYGRRTPGVDLNDARQVFSTAPQIYKDAGEEFRKLHRALLDVALNAGMISKQAYDKMAAEQYYSPLARFFGKLTDRPQVIGTKTSKVVSGAPTVVHPRKGGGVDVKIIDPFEQTIVMIPRMLKAAQLNLAKSDLIALSQANPKVGRWFLRPAEKVVFDSRMQTRITAIKGLMQGTTEDAQRMLAVMGSEPSRADPTLLWWNNGILSRWKVNPIMGEAFHALSPQQMRDSEQLISRFLDVTAGLTNVARSGIVRNPVFVARMFINDMFQTAVNSQYGVRPGIDNLLGWYENMRQGQAWKELRLYGGAAERFAIKTGVSPTQALRELETRKGTALTSAGNQLMKAIRDHEFKSLVDAYDTLVSPLFEAGRMAEYLAARRRGVGPVEAAYAAAEVVGNFQQTGAAMNTLARATLFLRPSIAALDQSWFSSGLHPFRTYAKHTEGIRLGGTTLVPSLEGRQAAAANYFIKGILGITLPTMTLWALYHDDEELQSHQRSEYGSRWIYFRDWEGNLQKGPNPIFEGQIFGTTMRNILDWWKGTNPPELDAWVRSIVNDASFNLLPLALAVPMSVWANQNVGIGGKIVPKSVEDLSGELQYTDNTTVPGRVIGRYASRAAEAVGIKPNTFFGRALTPAGMDFLIRAMGGTNAYEAAAAIKVASDYVNEGYVPPLNELPIIRRALVQDASLNIEPVEKFYEKADEVDRAAKSLSVMATDHPDQVPDFYERNKTLLAMTDLYGDFRKRISDLRAGIHDVEIAQDFPRDQKERTKKELRRAIIEASIAAYTVTRSIETSMQNARTQ